MADLLHMAVRCDELAPAAVRKKMRSLPGLGWALGDAMLVASELVTNAILHSLCTEDELLGICITRNGRTQISVLDPGAWRSAEIADRPIDLGGLAAFHDLYTLRSRQLPLVTSACA